ncbi:MAG: hypothetical protein HKM04_11735 [Legionellales bacterium]|nr:hypothetical protein [Legionellales bacterium]
MKKIKSQQSQFIKYKSTAARIDQSVLQTVIYHLEILDKIYNSPHTDIQLIEQIQTVIEFTDQISFKDVNAYAEKKIPVGKLSFIQKIINWAEDNKQPLSREIVSLIVDIFRGYKNDFIDFLEDYEENRLRYLSYEDPSVVQSAKRFFHFFAINKTSSNLDDKEKALDALITDYKKNHYKPVLDEYLKILDGYKNDVDNINREQVSVVNYIFNKVSELLLNNTLNISFNPDIQARFSFRETRNLRNYLLHIIDYPDQIYNVENIFINQPTLYANFLEPTSDMVRWVIELFSINEELENDKVGYLEAKDMALLSMNFLKENIKEKMPPEATTIGDEKSFLINLVKYFIKQFKIVLDAMERPKLTGLESKLNIEHQLDILGEITARLAGKAQVDGAFDLFIKSCDKEEQRYYKDVFKNDNRFKVLLFDLFKQLIDYRNQSVHAQINSGYNNITTYLKRMNNVIIGAGEALCENLLIPSEPSPSASCKIK